MSREQGMMESGVEKLLAAERLIGLVLKGMAGRLTGDQAGQLNSSLRFISETREQLAVRFRSGGNS